MPCEFIRRTFFENPPSLFGHFRVYSANVRVYSATPQTRSKNFRVHSAAFRVYSAGVRVYSAGEFIRQKNRRTLRIQVCLFGDRHLFQKALQKCSKVLVLSMFWSLQFFGIRAASSEKVKMNCETMRTVKTIIGKRT